MKQFIKILQRFLPPYKRYLFLSVGFNLLSAVLNVFQFAFIMPILEILFKLETKSYAYISFSDAPATLQGMAEVLKNNFYWYFTQLIDKRGEEYTLLLLGIVLVFMTLLKTGTYYLGSFFVIPIRTGVVRDIRNRLYHKILSLPLSFFSEERKGDIIARMSGDVNEVETSVMSSLDMLFKNPVLILIYLITMLLISWQLTIFVLLLLPISGYLMGTVGKKLKKKSLVGQQQWSNLMSQTEETLGGLRIVKAFNAQSKMMARFRQTNEKFRRTTNRINRRQHLAHPMSEFLGTATIAVVLWYGGSLILGDNATISASLFIYYLVVFYSILNPAKEFSKATYAIQKGLASMERIDKVLLAENTLPEPENPIRLEQFNGQIEFRNVWFKYQNDWVLKNINLTIPKGKTVALVGQSGSGKSTLVDLLSRYYDTTEGAILIDGTDVRQIVSSDLRAIMGNVNQEAILFNDTFYNNIAFGVDKTTLTQVEEAARIANAHEFIAATELGYESLVGDRGGKLSGGQRQRISIARAVLKNPPILILDEATSALDTESERLVQDALDNLMQNRTTIAIAHRLSTIRKADLICVLHEGEIVERGGHEELLARNGIYKKLWEMQAF